jgi:solute carrier family 12 sodium/potassium/chloride transporter 2
MALLLSKLRIEYSDIIIITDITKKASESSKKYFDSLISPFKASSESEKEKGASVTDADLAELKEKTNRHLRLRELLLEHSKEAALIVM